MVWGISMDGYRILLSDQDLYELDNVKSSLSHTHQKKRVFKKDIKKIFLDSFYIENEGGYMLDAEKLNQVWYPQIYSDIFISHSHKDVSKAEKLAEILYDKFGLVAFVDSYVWQSCDELLRRLDKKHCVLRHDKNGHTIFNYNQCMFSSSHVHMMLAVSLMQIIHGAKSIFVLDTDQSLFDMNGKIKTSSPWIFFELALSNILIQDTPLFEHFASKQEKLNVCYPIDISHLPSLGKYEFIEWIRSCRNDNNSLSVLKSVIKEITND